jgi:predicted aminopeptidase
MAGTEHQAPRKVSSMSPKIRILPPYFISRRIPLILLALFLALASLNCQSIQYYAQAIDGQMDILRDRQPISELLDDPDIPAKLQKELLFILSVRNFAEKNLQLPVKNHYLSYVELDRPCVVWNVFATPEFSLTPKTWCFPIVGCVTYRGYFSEQNAYRFGDSLKQKGFDVYIGGAIAYSTLGWFDDPVLSTFLNLSEPDTAALIFHELAHSVLYVSDDTAFNESFATAVEQEGLRRWQVALNDPEGYAEWMGKQQLHQSFTSLVLKYRTRLQDLYAGNLPENEKRNRKAALFQQMRFEFAQMKSERVNLAAYDYWFKDPLNNARLISVSTYNDWVPAFNQILSETGGNLNQFYQKCRLLAKKDPVERNRILEYYKGASDRKESAFCEID